MFIPLPGELQNFLNRMLPLMQSTLRWRRGRTRLSGLRAGVKIRQFVLVSTSGWWELANFGTALRIIQELAADVGVKFAGALLRPNFSQLAENAKKAGDIYAVAKQAGYQLRTEDRMSPELLEVISQPLTSLEEWRAKMMRETE